MKRLLFAAAVSSVFLFIAAGSAPAEEGYTFLSTEKGPQICIGRWVPPREVGLAGFCEGQIMSYPQLSALSSKQTVDRLDQLLTYLSSMDQKMTQGNDQLSRLIDATLNTQSAIERQTTQTGEFLRETITSRFETLPEEILSNDQFRKEITRLKEDILRDIEKRFPPKQTPPAK